MELEGSLPHSQVPATSPYPEPDQSFTDLHISLPQDYHPIYALVSQVVSFPQVSQPKPSIHLFSPPIHATCPAHLILLDFITRKIFGEQYRSLSSSIRSFLYSPGTSSILGPNIFLSTIFSNTFSLLSSLNVSDQVSHPYITDKVTVLYILMFKLLDS
jgi:hypothetical protein